MAIDTWYEVLVEASRDELEELLAAGAAAGCGRPLCDRDLQLELQTFGDRVLDLLRQDARHLVFATAPQARALLRDAAARDDVKVGRVRRIEGGRFAFRAKAYSEASAAEIRAALSGLPPGVAVEGLRDSEERHPEDKGVELFATAHDYIYRAEGTVAGQPPGLLEMYRRLEDLDFVHVGRLEIAGPEVPVGELAP